MLLAQWDGRLTAELSVVLPQLTGYGCRDALVLLFRRDGGCVAMARAPLHLSRIDGDGYARGIVTLIQGVVGIEGAALLLYGAAEHETQQRALLEEIRAEARAVDITIDDVLWRPSVSAAEPCTAVARGECAADCGQ